jgi:hypothetical protein
MQQDRTPLHSLESAVWRLVQLDYQGASPATLTACVQLVADVHWLTDDSIRQKMARYKRENGDRIGAVISDAVTRRRAVR